MPKALCKQCKLQIVAVLKYFKEENERGHPLLPNNAVIERTATALGISLHTVSNIQKEVTTTGEVRSPLKSKRKRPITAVTEGTEVAIRDIIYRMYQNKQHITLSTIHKNVKDSETFTGSVSSLRIILKRIGFRYRKDNPRVGLMELPNIVLSRFTFLEKYVANMRTQFWECVYLDETWVFDNGSACRSWQDNTKDSVRSIKPEGKRNIILHAGNKHGFIPGASLVFSSKTKNLDYHGEMNQENFLRWFEKQLLINLETPSIIVMDNASYHSTLAKKIPNSAWNKPAIEEWLNNNKIAFEPNSFKKHLLHLVALNKKKWWEREVGFEREEMSDFIITLDESSDGSLDFETD